MNLEVFKNEQYQKKLKLRKELLDKIKEEEFKSQIEELLKRVDFNKVELKNNSFTYVNLDKNPNIIYIGILNDKIYFSEQELYGNKVSMGIYQVYSSGKFYTKYIIEDKMIYKNNFENEENNDYDLYDVITNTIFRTFDEEQNELWYLDETKRENYYKNKITKEIIFPKESNCFENYIEKNYYFRDDSGYIIKRFIKEYYNHENSSEYKNEDYYLIDENSYLDSKKIPRGDYYVGISKELYSEYKLGKCDFDKVYKSRVRSKISTTYF